MTTEREPRTGDERLDRLGAWTKKRQRPLMIAGGVIAVVGLVILSTITQRARRESVAQRELLQARTAKESGNLPLASNDLQRLISSFGGTSAAEEGTLLLAGVHLDQNDPDLAVATLSDFLNGGPRSQFRGPGYGLLGVALEQAGRIADAGQAYLSAADATEFELLGLQFSMEAARAFTAAGDTGRAAAIYEGILEEHTDAPGLAEVRLRLAEIRRSGTES